MKRIAKEDFAQEEKNMSRSSVVSTSSVLTNFLIFVVILAAVALLLLAGSGLAQDDGTLPTEEVPEVQAGSAPAEAAAFKLEGKVITPDSSVAHPEDAGVRFHTNYLIFVPEGRQLFSPSPDFTFAETPASLADPASGVYVYDSYGFGGWFVVGGTSVSSPSLAGIVNNSNNRLGLASGVAAGSGGGFYSTEENNLLYAQLFNHNAYPANFYDVKTGSNGSPAGPGWDQCTGVGTPRGKLGK
jgi:hypothetical protein